MKHFCIRTKQNNKFSLLETGFFFRTIAFEIYYNNKNTDGVV